MKKTSRVIFDLASAREVAALVDDGWEYDSPKPYGTAIVQVVHLILYQPGDVRGEEEKPKRVIEDSVVVEFDTAEKREEADKAGAKTRYQKLKEKGYEESPEKTSKIVIMVKYKWTVVAPPKPETPMKPEKTADLARAIVHAYEDESLAGGVSIEKENVIEGKPVEFEASNATPLMTVSVEIPQKTEVTEPAEALSSPPVEQPEKSPSAEPSDGGDVTTDNTNVTITPPQSSDPPLTAEQIEHLGCNVCSNEAQKNCSEYMKKIYFRVMMRRPNPIQCPYWGQDLKEYAA